MERASERNVGRFVPVATFFAVVCAVLIIFFGRW